jgi:hypothetical protein
LVIRMRRIRKRGIYLYAAPLHSLGVYNIKLKKIVFARKYCEKRRRIDQ